MTVRQMLALTAALLVALIAAKPVDRASGVPVPTKLVTLLRSSFGGGDGTVAAAARFWDRRETTTDSSDWFAESGTLRRGHGRGAVSDDVFRAWTRRTDFAFAKVQMSVRFNHWRPGGGGPWHGVNLWLNYRLRTPDDGSRIADGPRLEGYTADFLNRDGKLYIQKKIGHRYLTLGQTRWSPEPGRWYRWGGRVIGNADGTNTIEVIVNGRVIQSAVDDGSIGGPRLTGGRVGLRGDYASFNVDDLTISAARRAQPARAGR